MKPCPKLLANAEDIILLLKPGKLTAALQALVHLLRAAELRKERPVEAAEHERAVERIEEGL